MNKNIFMSHYIYFVKYIEPKIQIPILQKKPMVVATKKNNILFLLLYICLPNTFQSHFLSISCTSFFWYNKKFQKSCHFLYYPSRKKETQRKNTLSFYYQLYMEKRKTKPSEKSNTLCMNFQIESTFFTSLF